MPIDSFSDAVVATWSAKGHSHAVGFRLEGTLAATRALDQRLLAGLALIEPGR